MIKLVSVQQMRDIEAAVDESLISYDQMMQRAGTATAKQAWAMSKHIPEPRVTILIGPGNNGGDGLVAAKFLSEHEHIEVRLYMLKRRDEDDPVFKPAQEAGLFIAYAEDDHDGRVLRHMCASADIVIDALFGIGITLPLRDDAAKLLRIAKQGINERRAAIQEGHIISPAWYDAWIEKPMKIPTVLAVDCPSGLDCDTGELDPNAIPADETITFIAAKHGLVTFPGAEAVGKLSVAPLDIPANHAALKDLPVWLIDGETTNTMLPKRPLDGNKGTFGKVMIVSGSINYSGAPALSAMAAYRSGSGLVTVAAPGPVIGTLAARLFEPTWVMLPHDMGVISEKAADVIRKELDGYNVLLIGPGLGQEETTGNMLRSLLERSGAEEAPAAKRRSIGFSGIEEYDKADSDTQTVDLPPMVVDADALNLLAKTDNWPALLPENTIITPHPGEMSRLSGLEIAEIQANRVQIATEKAAEWNVILVLKGAHTVIAAPDGRVAVLPFKSDALATAGTGDILAGLIAGMRGQGLDAYTAAVVGGYVHGRSGNPGFDDQTTNRSIIAGDVLDNIVYTLSMIEGA